MAEQHADRSLRPPARSLDAVVAAITAHATADVVAEFETALGAAWQRATSTSTIRPLLDLVDGWWPEAAAWATDPGGTRRINAEIERTRASGALPDGNRVSRDEAIARWERANGRPLQA
jgi:hypothetical protein